MPVTRLDTYRLVLEREGSMHQDAVVFASEKILVEGDALRQLRNAATLDPDAIVMATPDIHTGFGVPIGCVFATPNLISPCAVGYDINCGMRLLSTPFTQAEIDVKKLADSIRRDIPLGEGKANISVPPGVLDAVLERGVRATADVARHCPRLAGCVDEREIEGDLDSIEDGGSLDGSPGAVSPRAKDRGRGQFASLGGGNHFIEIQVVREVFDEPHARTFGMKPGQLMVMIHSGSRGLGHQVADEYMKSARSWDEAKGIELPDRELAYFSIESREGKAYRGAMNAAANFAFANRQLMAMLVRRNIRQLYGSATPLPTVYDVPHNIAKFEEHNKRTYCVHRKGATRAFPAALMRGTRFAESGQPVLIPGSMGTSSYVLSGVPSGIESLFSVNHGAGRTMSRTAASGVGRGGKRQGEAAITDEQFRASMEGIYLLCEDRRTIKEEAPGAYKDIDEVIAVVSGAGLALPVARMTPLAVMKG